MESALTTTARPTIRCFISYAHKEPLYHELFLSDFRAMISHYPEAVIEIREDSQIVDGTPWHEWIQREVNRCNLAILLINSYYMYSDYIPEHEFRRLLERQDELNLRVVPVYFGPLVLEFWPVLAATHMYIAKGEDYCRPKRPRCSFSEVVQFYEGVPTDCRHQEYMQEFVSHLDKQHLKDLVSYLKQKQLAQPSKAYVSRPCQESRILDLIRQGERLITITGFDGMGKTQLALQCAGRAVLEMPESFPDAYCFVELEHLNSRKPEVVTQAIGRSLSVATQLCLSAAIEKYLSKKEMILVLDGYEAAASPEVGDLLDRLLRNTRIRLLVTSRSPVGHRDERIVALREGMTEDEATTLFLQLVNQNRDQTWFPEPDDGHSISDILAGVERWPLGITWAAASVNMTSLAEVASEQSQRQNSGVVRDQGAADREAFLDWSLRILDNKEKPNFCLLSLFPDTFTLAAAGKVLHMEDGKAKAFMDRLVDAALVTKVEGVADERFRLHRFVRDYAKQYAKREIADNFVSQAQERFFDHCMAHLEPLPVIFDQGQGREEKIVSTLDAIETEWPNVVACAEFAIDNRIWELLSRLVAPLLQFLLRRGHMQEIESLFNRQELTEVPEAATRLERDAKGRILNMLGVIYQFQNRWDDAREKFLECLKALENEMDRAKALNSLGMIYQDGAGDDWRAALEAHKESAEICRRLLGAAPAQRGTSEWAVQRELATALANLAMPYEKGGRPGDADATLAESERIREEFHDGSGLADTYNCYGRVQQRRENWSEAVSYFEKRRKILEDRGDLIGLGRVYNSLGGVSKEWSKRSLDSGERELRLRKARDCFYLALGISWYDVCDPAERIQARKNLIELFMLQEKFADAIKMADALSKEQSPAPAILNCLGYAYLRTCRWRSGETVLKKALILSRCRHQVNEELAARQNLLRICFQRYKGGRPNGRPPAPERMAQPSPYSRGGGWPPPRPWLA